MKLIRSDNYGREGPGHDDTILCEEMDPHAAVLAAAALNNKVCLYYYKAVPDNYTPQKFEP